MPTWKEKLADWVALLILLAFGVLSTAASLFAATYFDGVWSVLWSLITMGLMWFLWILASYIINGVPEDEVEDVHEDFL